MKRKTEKYTKKQNKTKRQEFLFWKKNTKDAIYDAVNAAGGSATNSMSEPTSGSTNDSARCRASEAMEATAAAAKSSTSEMN